MRVQKLALAVGLVSALGGNGALALGLGEIKLNSTLNQPLDAEIKLLQTRGLGENEIKVRLASTEDFERAGVDRGYALDGIRFDVDYSSGQPVVRITSRTPIREPFLNFLVETRWPSGRLLREYTLLMDLPAFSTNTASQPVRAAERERQQVQRSTPVQKPIQPTVQRAPEPVQAPVEQPAPEEYAAPQESAAEQPQQPVYEEPTETYSEPQTATDSGSRVYGPVEANKTLWEIARDSRESRDLSVQQTMLAIQRLNPEAFINNNINLLKKGAVLRLPTADEVRNLSLTEAVSQVATQNDAWRERVGDADVTGAPLDARATVEETVESDVLEGRVSLAAPGDNESVLSGSGSGSSESEALEGELAVTEEELDKSRLESAELQERIGELNEQIDTMEQLVEVSNEELQAVQAAAEQTNEALESETEVDGFESESESELEPDVSGETANDTAALDGAGAEASDAVDATEAEVTETAEAEPEVEEETGRNRVVVQTRPEPTLVERIMDNIVPIGIGAGALLAGLFGFMSWRRRQEEEEAIRQVEAEMAAERAQEEAPEEPYEDDTLVAVEEFEANDNFDLDQLSEVETDDPVAEAEIHLSLDQYQEAEAKLLAGLKSAPENVDARLMLLEVYAHQQNADQFDDHYRQLLSYSDGPAADRAARLRETIAGIGAFVAPENDFSSESLEAAQLDDMGADFDNIEASFDDLDEFSATGKSDSSGAQNSDLDSLDDLSLELGSEDAATAPSDDEFSLDLDLGDDLSLDGVEETPAASAQPAEDDFTLDLGSDLELEADKPAAQQAAETSQEADDFNLDDLMADGELDLESLESLDLDGDLDLSSEGATAPADAEVDDGGLEFDLDLTPMDDTDESAVADDSAASAEVEPPQGEPELGTFDGELDGDLEESFGDDLGSLDLDSIDLGEFELEGEAESSAAAQVPSSAAQSEVASEQDLDLAVMEQPAAPSSSSSSQPAQESSSELGDLSFDLEGDLDSELNLLEGSDEVSTKLELAQAYLDMGDKDGAREILGEVVEEAAGEHQQRAKDMLERMS
ncbi:FimV/HubP family polar landmark protein [Microbulbifer sp. ARAS458-1]|uniref:FimV/HubP family polar landmark protein n=1 Tax=Microbulbifer sp. ARAS458-1 TaxID=3140242 RepID=UPI0038779862